MNMILNTTRVTLSVIALSATLISANASAQSVYDVSSDAANGKSHSGSFTLGDTLDWRGNHPVASSTISIDGIVFSRVVNTYASSTFDAKVNGSGFWFDLVADQGQKMSFQEMAFTWSSSPYTIKTSAYQQQLNGSYFVLDNTTTSLRQAPAVSAVPEPETYAMMLIGIGLLGFASRRNKKVACAIASS